MSDVNRSMQIFRLSQEVGALADVRSGSRLCEHPVDAMIPLLNRRGK
jgi:hypothetical protein